MSVSSVAPEPSALNSESLGYLGLDEKSEHEMVKCISAKRQTDDPKGSVELQKTSLPHFDILEASSMVTSESPSRGCNVPESKCVVSPPPKKGQEVQIR